MLRQDGGRRCLQPRPSVFHFHHHPACLFVVAVVRGMRPGVLSRPAGLGRLLQGRDGAGQAAAETIPRKIAAPGQACMAHRAFVDTSVGWVDRSIDPQKQRRRG